MAWDHSDTGELMALRTALEHIEAALDALVQQNQWAYLPGNENTNHARVDRVTGVYQVLAYETWRDPATDRYTGGYHWQPQTMERAPKEAGR